MASTSFAAMGRFCQFRSRSSLSPWNSPASISAFDVAGIEQVLGAGDRLRRAEERD